MIRLNISRLFVLFPYLLFAILALALTSCEQKPPAGITEGPQTDQAALPVAECEEFLCADIGSIHTVRIHVEENVGIGVPRDHRFQNELEVNGTILAEEVLVQPNVADYVFDPRYDLKSLDYVEKFIYEHHHLPGVPSSDTLQTSDGKLGIGESYRVLLEKIEELTLYAIEQNKRIEMLELLLAERHEAKE
jgi:hypothetical protein